MKKFVSKKRFTKFIVGASHIALMVFIGILIGISSLFSSSDELISDYEDWLI